MAEDLQFSASQLTALKARLRAGAGESPATTDAREQLPDLGVMFFSGLSEDRDPYGLLLDVARHADALGFSAIWTPERHFTEVGGAYPNPSVLAAALAMITERVRIRAGSVNLPLHDPLRVAEEWALVDNLSGGRVDLALAPGWHPRDFVLRPDVFEDRARILIESRAQLQSLWSGRAIERVDPLGQLQQILTFPRPVQRDLPIWLTTSQNPDAWRVAGETGLNVLSALINFGPPELERRIAVYRDARARVGLDPEEGVVSLMLHTYIDSDPSAAVERVRPALTEYLSQFVTQHASSKGGGPQGKSETLEGLGDERDDFLEMVFQRYVSSSSLIGDIGEAQATLRGFDSMGVDEVACLVDFGLSEAEIMESIGRLSPLLRQGAQR